MKLLTKEIIAKLRKTPLYATDGQNVVPVIVKFFTPDSSWTWYAVEGKELEGGDWEFFGLVEGLEKELGYFTLFELQQVRGGFGLRIERDRWFSGMVLDKAANIVRKAS